MLKDLKKDYADMITNSYKSKSSLNRLMFLFSSKDFLQAYKRIQYMKQYANYRKKQKCNKRALIKIFIHTFLSYTHSFLHILHHCAFILNSFPDPDVTNKSGYTALMCSARWGHIEICKLLLEHGANPNLKDDGGNTALHDAVASDQIAVCELLLSNKADFNSNKRYE